MSRIRRLQFQHHSSRNPAFLARRGPGQLREFADHRLHLGEWQVVFERVFSRNGSCRPIGHDWALVGTAPNS
jgi:hypothetical protein